MIDKLEALKKKVLVLDIETSAHYPDGKVVDISTNFDDYVKYAKVKWLGMYSYANDEYIELSIEETTSYTIQQYIKQHNVIVGFNSDEFDLPIMYNNDLMPEKYFNKVDCLAILGTSTGYRHDGLPFKNRGLLMGYKYKSNSLKNMAKTMELESQKGDIDYKIFHKDFWTPEETKDIKKYLRSDVEVTKQMFDELWDFWMPFTKWLPGDACMKLVWIKSSIASLTYQCACKTLGVEPTYADKSNKPKEEMGGRVIQPKYEEARKVWYVDFASLYPHIFCQFNLFSEIGALDGEEFYKEDMKKIQESGIWHGNDMFKVRGYYNIANQHPLSLEVEERLKLRAKLKREEPDHPLIYALKIYLNSLYGALRSEIFEQIHTPNAGWDCCWLGQQIQEYTEKRMSDFGFETIAGDTDSIFVMQDMPHVSRDYVKYCLNKIIVEIKDNMPFPAETFKIDIEEYIDYIMWPFSLEPVKLEDGTNKKVNGRLVKEMKAKKKNYCYLYKRSEKLKLKIVGLPIKKDNATIIGPKILEETLKPIFFANMRCKMPKDNMDLIVKGYLSEPGAIADLAREFKVKPASSYKKESQIQAQISQGYFNGQAGVIKLIKNKVVGKAGKTSFYCTPQEAVDNNLTIKDLDLTKLTNELNAFVEN